MTLKLLGDKKARHHGHPMIAGIQVPTKLSLEASEHVENLHPGRWTAGTREYWLGPLEVRKNNRNQSIIFRFKLLIFGGSYITENQPSWKLTVCPWKFMVGRWRFIQKWSILRGHSFIFRVKRENPSIWAVHLEVPWFYVTYLLANISIQRSSSSTLLFISGNAKGKAPIGGAYQAPITVALQKDAGKIRTNLLGVGGQTIFSWFMCW